MFVIFFCRINSIYQQFFIFFAWLTFGRMAVNPFGDDETDIDLEKLLESHIDVRNVVKHRMLFAKYMAVNISLT